MGEVHGIVESKGAGKTFSTEVSTAHESAGMSQHGKCRALTVTASAGVALWAAWSPAALWSVGATWKQTTFPKNVWEESVFHGL